MTRRLRTFTLAGAGSLALLLAGLAGTATAKDRNGDRIPDRWEHQHNLALTPTQADRDQDRDHVDNLNEFQEGTDPRDRDSDNDGRRDGREDADHDGLNNMGEDSSSNLPEDRDTDNDGVRDGDENAGTVATFDGTTLTIDLAGGGQVSGTVSAQTKVECETEDEHEVGDDNSGPGSTNSGPGSASASHDGGGGSDDSGQVETGDDDNMCTTADLIPGAVVHEAELQGTAFTKIELVK